MLSLFIAKADDRRILSVPPGFWQAAVSEAIKPLKSAHNLIFATHLYFANYSAEIRYKPDYNHSPV